MCNILTKEDVEMSQGDRHAVRWGWVEDIFENYHAYCAHTVRVNNLGNILHPPPPIQMDSDASDAIMRKLFTRTV